MDENIRLYYLPLCPSMSLSVCCINDVLTQAVYLFRDEIASCAEKAYETIAFSEAARMLFFESNKPMKIFAAQVSADAELSYHFSWVWSCPFSLVECGVVFSL